jgi:hypothetical protein
MGTVRERNPALDNRQDKLGQERSRLDTELDNHPAALGPGTGCKPCPGRTAPAERSIRLSGMSQYR